LGTPSLAAGDLDNPLGAIYLQNRDHVLTKIERRRTAARRCAARAERELRLIRPERILCAHPSEPVTIHEINEIPSDPVPFDSFSGDPRSATVDWRPNPISTQHPRDNWDNPALRL
jgi:hypothetical protein